MTPAALRARIAQLEARAKTLTGLAHNQALTDLAHARARHAYWEERAGNGG